MTAIDKISPTHQALANLQLSPGNEAAKTDTGFEAAICIVTPKSSPKSLSFRETVNLTVEYDAIRAEKEAPFSQLEEKYGLAKLMAALPKDGLKSKFDAEFSEMPEDPEFLRAFDLVKMAEFYNHQFVSDGQMERIKEAFSFSDLVHYDLELLLSLFTIADLRQKFDVEFVAASDTEILTKIDLPTLDKMAHMSIVPEERMKSILSLPEETLWSTGKSFLEMHKKDGLDFYKNASAKVSSRNNFPSKFFLDSMIARR